MIPKNLIIKGKDIKYVTDLSFHKYGKVVEGYDFEELHHIMEHKLSIPEEGNVYVPSSSELELDPLFTQIKNSLFGCMDIQIGYCNGNNSSLNGLEYHKGSEINYAVTDLVLLLGLVQDIINHSYDSKNVEAFFIPKGTAIEMYQTTLHFAPLKVDKAGFKCIVILPKGTNEPLENFSENEILFMKNKWLIVHPENKNLIDKGAFSGIIGENLHLES